MKDSKARTGLLKTLDALSGHLVVADKELHEACSIAQSINREEADLVQETFDTYIALKQTRHLLACSIARIAEMEYIERY